MARSNKGQSRSPLKHHEQWLLDLVRREPDLTLEEIQRRLLDEREHKAGRGALCAISWLIRARLFPSSTRRQCAAPGALTSINSLDEALAMLASLLRGGSPDFASATPLTRRAEEFR